MKIICIPCYWRLDCLPQVLDALATCQQRSEWQVWLGADNVQLPTTITSKVERVVEYHNQDCDYTIAGIMHEAFKAGAEQFLYLADDCVPAPDFLRLATFLQAQSDCVGYGLWWPSTKEALPYPQAVVAVGGAGWPSKAFGVRPSVWPEVYFTILRWREARIGTYDVALARWLHRTEQRICVPILARTHDISQFGTFEPDTTRQKYQQHAFLQTTYEGNYERIL